MDESGETLGTHGGYWRFTAGQRRGLGISSGDPLYVVGTDAAANTVVVGPRSSLARSRVHVRGTLDGASRRVEVKLRHRSAAVPATVVEVPSGFELVLDEPAFGVAPGQTAVLYDDDAVVGSGVIVGASAT